MSTPGAIAVYTSGSGTPANVAARPWRGVYHHFDGYPAGLGAELINLVGTMHGDMMAVFGQFEKAADQSLQVSPENPAAVCYVYVFDTEERRLDAFATYSGAHGERIGSVSFSAAGEPDRVAFELLLPEELIEETPLPGSHLSAEDLRAILASLPRIETSSGTLQWVAPEERPDGGLSVVYQVLRFEDGVIAGIVENSWNLVPAAGRSEPDRVRHCLEALVDVFEETPTMMAGVTIALLDPLRRSGARQRATFAAVFKAHARQAQSPSF